MKKELAKNVLGLAINVVAFAGMVWSYGRIRYTIGREDGIKAKEEIIKGRQVDTTE